MVRRAITLVDTMGVLEEIASWKAERRRGPGGRPEKFPVRALLVAMVVCALSGQPLLVSVLCEVLYLQISPALRLELGVVDTGNRDDPTRWRATYRNVRTRLHGLLRARRSLRASEEPLPRPGRLRKGRGAAPGAALVRGARVAPHAPHLVCQPSARGELSHAPARLARTVAGFGGCRCHRNPRLCPSRGRRHPQKKGRTKGSVRRHSSDPDAAWYHRDPDRRDQDTGPGKASVWGYELSVVVTGTDDPSADAVIPTLALGMAPLHRPSHAPGPNAIEALTSIWARGHPAGWLAADRAYTNSKAENYQLPARAFGYKLLLDYKSDQLGVQASHGGMIQVEGAWYCPSLPETLISATVDFDNGTIDATTYRARIEERRRYRILPRSRPDADGHIRARCPAANPSPMLRCDLKPQSVTLGTRGRGRVIVRSDVAQHPPSVCTQQSITLPPKAGAKFAQEISYRSEEWHARYGTLRNAIEGYNGFIKDGAHEALDDPERRRVRGVAAQSVFVAFLLLAANLCKIDSALAELAAIKAGKVRRLPRRRRTASLATWRPDVPATAASGPDPPLLG